MDRLEVILEDLGKEVVILKERVIIVEKRVGGNIYRNVGYEKRH